MTDDPISGDQESSGFNLVFLAQLSRPVLRLLFDADLGGGRRFSNSTIASGLFFLNEGLIAHIVNAFGRSRREKILDELARLREWDDHHAAIDEIEKLDLAHRALQASGAFDRYLHLRAGWQSATGWPLRRIILDRELALSQSDQAPPPCIFSASPATIDAYWHKIQKLKQPARNFRLDHLASLACDPFTQTVLALCLEDHSDEMFEQQFSIRQQPFLASCGFQLRLAQETLQALCATRDAEAIVHKLHGMCHTDDLSLPLGPEDMAPAPITEDSRFACFLLHCLQIEREQAIEYLWRWVHGVSTEQATTPALREQAACPPPLDQIELLDQFAAHAAARFDEVASRMQRLNGILHAIRAQTPVAGGGA